MSENDKNLKERDFHHGEGHKVPWIIRFVWTVFAIFAISYFVKNIIPYLHR